MALLYVLSCHKAGRGKHLAGVLGFMKAYIFMGTMVYRAAVNVG